MQVPEDVAAVRPTLVQVGHGEQNLHGHRGSRHAGRCNRPWPTGQVLTQAVQIVLQPAGNAAMALRAVPASDTPAVEDWGGGGEDSTTALTEGGDGDGRVTTAARVVVGLGFGEGEGLPVGFGGENEISAMAVPASNPLH